MFFSKGVLSKRYFTIRGSDSVVILTWYDEEDCVDANGCVMLSYVEPVPPNLRKVKLNAGISVETADFSNEISRKSQEELLTHSFKISFSVGPALKLCAENEDTKLEWMKAINAAIESPESWKAFTNTANKELDEKKKSAASAGMEEPDAITQFLKLMRDEKDVPEPKRRLSHCGKMLFSRTVVNFSSSQRAFRTADLEEANGTSSKESETTIDEQENIPAQCTAHPYKVWEDLTRRKPKLASAINDVLRVTLHSSTYTPPEKDERGNTMPFELMSPDMFGELATEIAAIMSTENSLVRVEAPIKVFGDIHGQVADLLTFFSKYGYPSHVKGDINCVNYLFAGDYVDRGSHGLEVLCILFCLKARYQPHVTLLRGNHEDASVNVRYGFRQECISRMIVQRRDGPRLLSVVDKDAWTNIYKNIQSAFNIMPLGALISEKILVVHGGIGQNVWKLEDIENVKRPFVPLGESMNLASDNINPVAIDLLWSDPTDDSVGMHPHALDSFNMKRGVGTKFGVKAVENFCRVNDVDLIVRAHECIRNGWKLSCNDRCVTVFSAPNYCGTHGNAGAMLEISRDLNIHCKKVLPRSSKGTWTNEVDATPPPSDASSVSSTEETWL